MSTRWAKKLILSGWLLAGACVPEPTFAPRTHRDFDAAPVPLWQPPPTFPPPSNPWIDPAPPPPAPSVAAPGVDRFGPEPDAGAPETADSGGLDGRSADGLRTETANSLRYQGLFQVVARISGKCLAVEESAGENQPVEVEQTSCSSSDRQVLRVESLDRGNHRLISVKLAKCLEVTAQAAGDPLPVRLWKCDSTIEQYFALEPVDSLYVRLVGLRSGKCLSVDRSGAPEGAALQATTCKTGEGAQHFRLLRLGSTDRADDDPAGNF